MQLLIKSFGKWIRVIVVYRPPPSATNKLTTSLFLSEFTTLLENLSITSGELLILGDFNLHVDKPSDPDASQLFSLLYAFGLTQHVRESTHTHGHTLDLGITRSNETTVFDTNMTLTSGVMPNNLKEAVLIPLLKKIFLELFKNFRPVSNLTFLSKLIERVVALRLHDHMKINNLYEEFQS